MDGALNEETDKFRAKRMALAIRNKKTEHAGAKNGAGAYWGKRESAKRASKKERRRVGKILARLPDEEIET